MATLSERQRFKSRLLSQGIEWDDRQINSFLDSQTSNNTAALKSVDNLKLPHSRIVGPSDREKPDVNVDIGYGPLEAPEIPEARNAGIDLAGNLLWNALDIGTFGIAGLADVDDAVEDFLTGEEGPSTFSGRVGAGIGGLIGFMGPMTGVKAVTGAAVKGLSKYGTKQAGIEMAKQAGKKGAKHSLSELKTFNSLAQKEREQVFKPFVEMLEQNSKSHALESKAGREAFTKLFNQNMPIMLKQQLKDAGINVKSADKLKYLEDVVRNNVLNFKGRSFPITTLQQRIAIGLGGSQGAGKIASIASHSLEEALIFAAVETPMELFNSIEEKRDADYAGTIAHAFTLGSALGLIRMIPGGKQQGIIREGGRRLFGHKDYYGNKIPGILSNRNKFANYDITKAGTKDNPGRTQLVKYVQGIWKGGKNNKNGKIFDDLKLTNPDGTRITGLDDIAELGKTPKGAAELKRFMGEVETNWQNIWAKEWVKEAGADLWGSTPRMIAGAMAFNHDIIFDDRVPFEDKVFNVLVGAYMTKRGRAVEYRGSDGQMHVMSEGRFTYGEKIKDAAMYLDRLGMPHSSSRFEQVLTEWQVREEYLSVDKDNPDIKLLVEILDKGGFIVDQDHSTKGPKRKAAGRAGYNPLYEHIQKLIDGPLTPGDKRMLRPDEVSRKRISKLNRLLQDTQFEGSKTGVLDSKTDLDYIMYKAAEPKLKAVTQVYHDFVRKAFQLMGGSWEADPKDGSVIIRRANPEAGAFKEGVDSKDIEAFYSAFDVAVRILSRSPDSNFRVTIDPNPKNILQVPGAKFEGMDKTLKRYEDQLNTIVYPDSPPIESRIRLGEDLVNTWMESQSYYKGVRDVYDKIDDILNKKGTWDHNKEDAAAIDKLIQEIFIKEGMVASNVEVDTTPSDAPELQQFVSAMHQFVQSHPNYKAPFGLLLSSKTGKGAAPDSVRELRRLLSKNGMGGFAVGGSIGLERFIHDLRRYGLETQLSSARNSKGQLLTDVERSKIHYMMENGIIDSQFNILNIRGVVDGLRQLGIPGAESSAARITSGLGAEDVPIEGMYVGDKGLYTLQEFKANLDVAAKRNNMKVEEFSKKLMETYESQVLPLMKTAKGDGILTPTTVVANPTPEFLQEIVSRMELIDIGAERVNHQKLISEIERMRSEAEGTSTNEDKLVSTIYHRFWNRQRDSRTLINILAENGLYNRHENKLTLEGPKDAEAAIKEALSSINRLLPWSDNIAKVQQRVSEYMDEFDFKHTNIDDFKPMTPNNFKDTYGIDKEDIRNTFDDKTLDDPFEVILKDIRKDGKTYGELSRADKSQAVADIISMYRNHVNTVNITRVMAADGAGAIADTDHTFTNNSLFRSISDVIGDGNFYIVDFKVMMRDGVVDARTDKNAQNYLRGSLYDTHAAIRSGYKESDDLIRSRIFETEDSVLITLPEANWGIAIPKVNLPELGRKFIEVNKTMKDSPEGRNYSQALKAAKKIARKIETTIEKRIKEDEFVYHVDSEVQMFEDPRIIAGDNQPRDVWVVPNLEAAQRQLQYMKDGLGGAKNFSDTIERFEDHYIVRDNKMVPSKKKKKTYVPRGDHKHIYIQDGSMELPEGLKPDPNGRMPGQAYTKAIEVEETHHKWKHSSAEVDGHFATEMLTHIWMSKRAGLNWWDSLEKSVNSKSPQDFTNIAIRMKLMSNVSMYEADTKITKLALKHMKTIDSESDHVKGLERIIENEGNVNFIILKDENEASKVFSAYENIKREIEAEIAINKNLKGRTDTEAEDWGGSEDASMVDSYVPVSREIMRAFEALAAAGNVSGIGGIKPIIHKYVGANGRGAILGKTVFVYSKEFDTFFENNPNVHGIMMDSAEKLKDPTVQRIELPIGDTFDTFLSKTFEAESPFIHKIALSDISLGAVKRPDHASTLSQQIATDLNISEGQRLYDWLLMEKMDGYIETAQRIFNETDPIESIAHAQYYNNIPDSYDGMSAYSRWIKHGGIPFSSPFIQTMKNNVKKTLIDDGGLITMKNEHGTQSVLVPNLPGMNRSLRNTMFYRNKDGKRVTYKYGAIELADVNRYKQVILDRLHVISHKVGAADTYMTWAEFAKGDGKNLDVKNGMKLGEIHDKVNGLDLDYEIAITSFRGPKTRPGDILINGLKGFLDPAVGNQVRINAFDLKQRIEGDFDVDVLNSWWDTPTEVFKKWDSVSGAVGAVSAPKVKSSLGQAGIETGAEQGLGFFSPGSIEKYNKDQANASYMRGKIVGMGRMLQFLDHYSGKHDGKKVIFRAGNETGRIIIDADKMDEAKRLLAEDIQNIVDSKKGYDSKLYRDNIWQEKFLYGEGDADSPRYQGIFSWESWNSKDGTWDTVPGSLNGNKHWVIAKESINSLMAPYKGLLQVGSGLFEDGKRVPVKYDDLMEASSRFDIRMEHSGRVAYNRLMRTQGIGKTDLDRIFKDKSGRNWHNPFGDIVANVTKGDLLPFERAVKTLASNDNARISVPRKMFGEQLAKFEEFSSKYIELSGEPQQTVLKEIINGMQQDAKTYGYINYLDWRIKSQTKSMYDAKRHGNTSLSDIIKNDIAKLSELREGIESTMMTSKPIVKMLLTQSQKRITYDIVKNWKNNRWTDGFQSYNDALKWVRKNQGKILKMAKKEPLRIRGISSTEQMDMIIWNEMLQKFENYYIAPNTEKLNGRAAMDFETDLYKFRKEMKSLWRAFFEDKQRRGDKRSPWLDENMIMEQLNSSFNTIYEKWEGVTPGLGRLALMKIMSPQKELGAMTYFNGQFLESFKSNSPSFIKFGLRWLSNTDKESEMVKDQMFKTFADQYNALYRTFKGLDAPPDNFGHALFEETVKYNRETMYNSPAPLLDHTINPIWKRNEATANILSEVNPDIAATFGYNDNFTVGYMLSSRVVGPEWIGHAKAASAYEYTPNGFIPNDYQGGKLQSIYGWDSYNDAKYNEARLFLGDALGGNTLFYRHQPRVGATFEESSGAVGHGKETSNDTRQSIKNRYEEAERDCKY